MGSSGSASVRDQTLVWRTTGVAASSSVSAPREELMAGNDGARGQDKPHRRKDECGGACWALMSAKNRGLSLNARVAALFQKEPRQGQTAPKYRRPIPLKAAQTFDLDGPKRQSFPPAFEPNWNIYQRPPLLA
jgi:hypothetical protein